MLRVHMFMSKFGHVIPTCLEGVHLSFMPLILSDATTVWLSHIMKYFGGISAP